VPAATKGKKSPKKNTEETNQVEQLGEDPPFRREQLDSKHKVQPAKSRRPMEKVSKVEPKKIPRKLKNGLGPKRGEHPFTKADRGVGFQSVCRKDKSQTNRAQTGKDFAERGLKDRPGSKGLPINRKETITKFLP